MPSADAEPPCPTHGHQPIFRPLTILRSLKNLRIFRLLHLALDLLHLQGVGPLVADPVAVDFVVGSCCMLLWRRSVVVAFAVCLALVLMGWAKWQILLEESAEAALRATPVHAPEAEPAVAQASIDLAMDLFQIQLPHNVNAPLFDPTLVDRGITSRASWYAEASVRIGPAAFSSWALLGSTLAHEIEVHGRQNFWLIGMMDAMGLDGTGMAERQAYLHELSEAERFSLSRMDRKLIADTMHFYYPEDGRRSVTAWRSFTARLTQMFAVRWMLPQ